MPDSDCVVDHSNMHVTMTFDLFLEAFYGHCVIKSSCFPADFFALSHQMDRVIGGLIHHHCECYGHFRLAN